MSPLQLCLNKFRCSNKAGGAGGAGVFGLVSVARH